MKKILYVEDNQDTAEAVKIILGDAGFEADIAFSGKAGIKKAISCKYDLILLDIMMPDMSGWDVFEKLKVKCKTNYVFLSMIPISEERMQELRKSGIRDYITKPFEKGDLIRRINKILV